MKCCFCLDDLENHHSNLQHPGGVNRWLCGTCAAWANLTLYLRDREDMQQKINEEVAAIEKHAEELATSD